MILITKHPVLMHEYGHTFDSRKFGLAYLFTIGIPSAISADNSSKENGNNHRWFWTELRANNAAKDYFEKNYNNINWSLYEDIYSTDYYPTKRPSAEQIELRINYFNNQ